MAGLKGLKLYKQQITVQPKTTESLDAYRGLSLMYTDINHGNAIVSIRGQVLPGINVIKNDTNGALIFDGTGGFLNLSNTQSGVLSIYNNSEDTACNFYVLIISY